MIPLRVEGPVGLFGGPLTAGGIVGAFDDRSTLILGVNALLGKCCVLKPFGST